MNFATVDWATIAAMTTVLMTGGGVALVVIRTQLARYFVTRTEHRNLDDRVERVERKVGDLPTKQDVTGILERLASGQEKMTGLQEAIGRVERVLNLMLKSALDKESKS